MKEDRRSFILRSMAAGLGLYSVPSVSAAWKPPQEPGDSLNGLQRSCYPFAPERVVVMTNSSIDRLRRNWPVDAAVHTSLREQFQLPAAKHDVIFRLMQVMTDYYRVPHLFRNWATRLTKREALASTSIGRGFAYFHQFQDDGWLKTANPPVDWWLALFPEGIEWDSLDGDPVFGLIGHVFCSDHFLLPATTLRTYCLTDTIGRMIGIDPINNWARIACMEKTIAARAVNQVVLARYLSELESLNRSVDPAPAGKLVTAGS